MRSSSKELGDGNKVRFFKIFQSGEGPIEILSQVKHLLAHFNNISLITPRHNHHPLHDAICDQRCPLQLLAYLKCNVETTNCNK
jgi:hypothetical protein